jgi:hypothetical protein
MVRSIGIDPGDRVVSVVELDGSYRKTRLLSSSSAALGLGGDAMRPDIIADAVREALDSGMKGELTLGHPCREAVLRTIELPFKGVDAIKKVVKAEIETEIFTHSVDEMIVDFHELGALPNGGTKLLVAAVPKPGLRSQLHSMSAQNIDPERVDLDTMALWRVADWAGAFDLDDDEEDTAKPVHAVVDLSSRSVKVILVEGDQLVEMRVLRFGDSVAAEQVARAHHLDPEQARLTIEECLRTGADVHVESMASVPALVDEVGGSQDGEHSDGEHADGDVVAADGEITVASTTTNELVTYSEVDAANTKYLQRLARELTRFLTASGMAASIRSVWMSGVASRGNGVSEVLEAVFGYAPQELDVLSHMSHDLGGVEASERSPGLAIAVGLALGRMGGPEGFNLRQEDLAQTGGFDRIKFPLAIACMVSLLAMFVFATQKSIKLKVLELEIGQTYFDPDHPNAAIFHGQLNSLCQGKWFKTYFGVTKGKSTIYSHTDLMKELLETPVANRVRLVRDKLRIVAAQKQKASGVYEDVALESGLAVMVRWAEVLKSIEPEIGRYLVASVDLDMKSRKLSFTMALRGEDFRARQNTVQRAFQLEISKPDSPFQKPVIAGQQATFAGTATPFADYKDRQVAGAHIAFILDIKELFQPFGPSSRLGALLDNTKQPRRDYLAMNQTPAARTEEEVR